MPRTGVIGLPGIGGTELSDLEGDGLLTGIIGGGIGLSSTGAIGLLDVGGIGLTGIELPGIGIFGIGMLGI